MKTLPSWMGVALAAAMLAAPGAVAAGDETTDDAGSISGVVRFKGDIPEPVPAEVASGEDLCHKEKIYREDLVVSKDARVSWAVVTVKKAQPVAESDPEDAEGPVLDQQGCRYVPHVVVVDAGEKLTVLNSDGILHNVNTKSKKNLPKNIAMVASLTSMDMKFKRAERIPVKCDVHPWMGAWIVVTDDPLHAVTGVDGTFRIDNVPAGAHTLELWHESLGTVTREVEVAKGSVTEIEFELSR